MAAVELASTSLFSDGNLVAYYKLEDTADSIGSRTLTNNGSASFVTAKFNNGGQTDVATPKFFSRAADNYGIAGSGDLTVSYWVKMTAAPSSGNTVGHGIFRSQLTADRYLSYAYKNNGGTLQLLIDNSGTTATYNVDLGTSAFHNIILSRTGAASLKVYLDGVDTGISAAQGSSTAGTSSFGISTNGAVSSDAIYDDVAIFSRTFTQADVNIVNGITSTIGSAFLFNFV